MKFPRPHDDPVYADTAKTKTRPLRLRALFAAGAFRVTHPPDGKGGYRRGRPADEFAIVTPVNEQQTGPLSPAHWPSKPSSVETAIRLMQNGWLDNGKFLQIVDSARALGLSDAEIFSKASR